MDSDVDILITVQAEQAKAELAATEGAVNRVTDAAERASGGNEGEAGGSLGAVVGKFGHMGRVLRMVNPELGHMAHATHLLEMMADPAALAGVAVAGLALAFYKAYEAHEKLKEADVIQLLADEKIAVDRATAGWESYWKAIAEGHDKAFAEMERTKGELGEKLAEERKERDANIASLHAEIEAKTKANAANEEALEDAKRQAEIRKDTSDYSFWISKVNELTGAIDSNNMSISRATGMIEQWQQRGGRTATQLGELTKAEKEHTDAVNEAAKALELHEKVMARMVDLRTKHLEELAQAVADENQFEIDDEQEKNDAIIAADDALLEMQMANDEEAEAREQEKLDAIKKQWTDYADHVEHVLINTLADGVFIEYVGALQELGHAHGLAAKLSEIAFKKMANEMLNMLGREAAEQALFEFAASLASWAWGNVPAAEAHGLAAAEFAAIAATAGVGAAATGGISGGGGGGGGAGGGSYGGGSYGGGGSNGPSTVVQVTVIGTLDDADAQRLHDQITSAAQRGNW